MGTEKREGREVAGSQKPRRAVVGAPEPLRDVSGVPRRIVDDVSGRVEGAAEVRGGVDAGFVKGELCAVFSKISIPLLRTKVDEVSCMIRRIMDGEVFPTDTVVRALYVARNISRIVLSGGGFSEDELIMVSRCAAEMPNMDIDESLISAIAAQLCSNVKSGDLVVVAGAERNMPLICAVVQECCKRGARYRLDVSHSLAEKLFLDRAVEGEGSGISALGQEMVRMYEGAKIRVGVASNTPPGGVSSKRAVFMKEYAPVMARVMNGEMDFAVTIVPTSEEALLEGMSYSDLLSLYAEACDQPVNEVRAAQGGLIEKFDFAKELRFTNSDGTDLKMNIDGMTFCNAADTKNVPGYEFFSAPVAESLNGKLVSKGTFVFRGMRIVDITLEFKDGVVVSASASEGEEGLKGILVMDEGKGEGVKKVGEVGIGTNSHLRRMFVSGMMAEKVSGSFHIALGNALGGFGAKTDNGNRSSDGIHWDIATMLRGKNGTIELDGKVVQRNGVWVLDDGVTPDPKMEVLNQGWAALPEERRPEWFKEKYPRGYED